MTIDDYKNSTAEDEYVENINQQDMRDVKEPKSDLKMEFTAHEKLDILQKELEEKKQSIGITEKVKEAFVKLETTAHKMLDARESPLSPQVASKERENIKEDIRSYENKWERQHISLNNIRNGDDSNAAKDYVMKERKKILKEQEMKAKAWQRKLDTIDAREKAWNENS